MPTKTTPHFASTPRYSIKQRQSDGNTLSFSSPKDHVWTNTFTGVSLPDWKERIAKGLTATTPASGFEGSFRHKGGETNVWWSDGTHRYLSRSTGYLCQVRDPVDPSSFDSSIADTQARLTFLKKYRSARTGFQSGVFLGELLETVRMLKDPAKAFRKTVDDSVALLRGNVRKNRGAYTKAMAESHLEVVMGWKPLISDINSAYRTLYDLNRDYWRVIRATGGWKSSQKEGETVASGATQEDSWKYFYGYQRDVAVRYLGAVDCKFEPRPGLAERLGFVPDQFFPTIWELIPYSFLVDYFTNIGDLIDGMSLGRVYLRWGCRTTRKKARSYVYNFEQTFGSFGSGKLPVHYARAPVTESFGKSFVRSDVNSLTVGLNDFHFELPGIGSQKWTNIAALAHLRFLKKKPPNYYRD